MRARPGNDRRCARVFTGATGTRTGDGDSQSDDHRSRTKFEPAAVRWLARLALEDSRYPRRCCRSHWASASTSPSTRRPAATDRRCRRPWQWLALIPVATLLLVVAATGLPARLATRIRTADALRCDTRTKLFDSRASRSRPRSGLGITATNDSTPSLQKMLIGCKRSTVGRNGLLTRPFLRERRRRAQPRWLIRHQPDYTPTTQALPGGSRSWPLTAGSHDDKKPAVAVILGRSRLYRLSSYRSVTPEVAGSSPVAPVKSPANRHVVLST